MPASTSTCSGASAHTVVEIANEQEWELHFSDVSACDLVVDAIFGTGLSRPLTGLFETIVGDVNASALPVVADRPAERAVWPTPPTSRPGDARPTVTVTFAAPKLPHVLPPARGALRRTS